MSPLRFFTAEDPDMARVRAIRRQVFVQDLGVPEQQEFDAADLPGADTVYALLTAESNPLGTGRLFTRCQRAGQRPPTGYRPGTPGCGARRRSCAGGCPPGGCGFLREVGICALRRAVYAAGYAPFAYGINRGGTAPPVGRERP